MILLNYCNKKIIKLFMLNDFMAGSAVIIKVSEFKLHNTSHNRKRALEVHLGERLDQNPS